MVLLDTCTLLWLVDGQRHLSGKARGLIAESAGSVFVSAISGFEIGVKHRRGQLELPLDPEVWFDKAVALHGLVEIPVSGRIAARSAGLRRTTPTRATGC